MFYYLFWVGKGVPRIPDDLLGSLHLNISHTYDVHFVIPSIKNLPVLFLPFLITHSRVSLESCNGSCIVTPLLTVADKDTTTTLKTELKNSHTTSIETVGLGYSILSPIRPVDVFKPNSFYSLLTPRSFTAINSRYLFKL